MKNEKHAIYARNFFNEEITLQGNLDPCQLYASKAEIEASTKNMLMSFGRNHIANLGHGVYPDTELDKIKCFIETVKNFKF